MGNFDVRNCYLLQGPKGEQGAPGPQGPGGTQGLKGSLGDPGAPGHNVSTCAPSWCVDLLIKDTLE